MTDDSKPTLKLSKQSPLRTTSNSKHSVPTSFQLFNHTIRVQEIPDLPEMGKYGDSDYALNLIRLFTDGCASSVIEHTFYHELAHFLLHYAGRGDLAEDEVLVDTLGALLAQYEVTKR